MKVKDRKKQGFGNPEPFHAVWRQDAAPNTENFWQVISHWQWWSWWRTIQPFVYTFLLLGTLYSSVKEGPESLQGTTLALATPELSNA
jgi:hypothetical protein